MIVIHSSSRDVHENLAAEDFMLDDEALTEPVVFIYRNDDAVVIGKNQNPWRECAVSRLESLGVKLARRVTGGGTVYHDAGNVNISCIVPRADYRREEMLGLFIDGLRCAGVEARIVATTSLAVGGKKISGNAFCYRRDKVLHHGTLLWRSDLEKLRACLVPDIPDLETRAVASCPMPVVNLYDLLKGTAPESLLNSVIDALSSRWGAVRENTYNPFAGTSLASKVAAMRSWDWLYGATPDFQIRQDGGIVHVHRGLVAGSGRRFEGRSSRGEGRRMNSEFGMMKDG